MIVMKFGGSSVESASAIERVAGIVKGQLAAKPVVVVSAIGKTTDRLLHIAEFAAQGDGVTAWRKLLALKADHLQIAAKLKLAVDREIEDLFAELRGTVLEIARLGSLSPELWDAAASFGERLSSTMVAAALRKAGVPAAHLDARKLIVTDRCHNHAAPLTVETNAKIRRAIPCVDRNAVPVLGGFIAASEDGTPTTLGRGGSDYTAAIVGAAIGADEIQIWTDVDGMLTCDPRVHEGGLCLQSITYEEAEQMARLGAKVLHPETVLPARKQRIPVTIRNSRNAAHPGTTIHAAASGSEGTVKSIPCEAASGMVSLVGTGVEQQAERAANALRQAGLAAAVTQTTRLAIRFQVPAGCAAQAVSALHDEFFTTRPVSGRTTTPVPQWQYSAAS
jgi:aspartate kinase